MKRRTLLAWLVFAAVLTSSRLAAQDVTVTDPAWFDSENAPADQLPTFKKRPKPDFPEELLKPEQVAYAIVQETLDEKGKRLNSGRLFSNPYLEKVTSSAVAVDALKYIPATRSGKPVMVSCWFGIIFNPHSASPKRDDATPRLLAVAPIVLDRTSLPSLTKTPRVIWATLSLNEKGELQKYTFDDPAYENIREQVGGSLHLWKFAAARRGGQAVAAELHVPLILNQAYRFKMPGTPPKVLYREQPIYPFVMKATGLRGDVLLEFIIDKTGAVRDPVIVRTNNPGFNEAAIDALLKWKFEPGRVDGELRDTKMQQPFVFDMGGSGARDYVTIPEPTKKNQQKLPPELQYDRAPKAMGLLEPVYPYALLRDRLEGHATVAFLVNAQGKVSQVVVSEASHPEFGFAMAAAVEAFEFIPALKDGKPTNAGLRIERKFDDTLPKEKELLALEKKHPERIFSAKKLDRPLKPVFQRSPVFPRSLQGRLDHGEVNVEILIDEEGKTRLPRIMAASDPAVGYAAVQAIAAWRFEPPRASGKSVVVRVQVPFNFKLEVEIPAPVSDLTPIDSAMPQEKQP
jgi:TonB family protein